MGIVLGKDELSIADVASVARGRPPLQLHDDAVRRLESARAILETWSREDRPVYGVTRGLGRRAMTSVAAAERNDYSKAVVLARASGAGGYFEREVTRAALFARAAGLVRGGAGVRPIIVETQLRMLGCGVHPLVPKVGSIGASDLMLCANLALPMIGEGRAEYDGNVLPGAVAMERSGIPTVQLVEREGLALCSSNAVSVGLGALVLQDIIDYVELGAAVIALSFEAFRANLSPIDPRAVDARPAPGQGPAAALIRRMLGGSALFDAEEARRIQDPISLRCASHVLGALHAGIDFARPNVEIELNAAADNPLILLDDQEILHTGNFHTPSMSIAFDALRLAISQAGSISAQRTARLLDAELSELPFGLSKRGVTRFGFGLIGLTAATLARELRYLASPVSTDDSGTVNVEDHAPMTPVAVRKAYEQIGLLRQILACELIVGTQALAMRELKRVSPVVSALAAAVRDRVAPLDDDRATTPDIELVAELIANGELLGLVRSTLSS